MNVEIINVGTELLLGEIVNTNATYLLKMCKELGFNVYYQSVVGDNPIRYKECLEIAFDRGTDCVITTGGLGPTADDLTKELSAEFLGLKLVYDPNEEKKVAEKCKFVSGMDTIPDNNYKQAFFPETCFILENEVGTANGCVMKKEKRMIVNLPGPPKEMRYVVEHELKPYLKQYKQEVLYTMDIVTMRIGESMVAKMLEDIIDRQDEVTIALYASEQTVRIRLGCKSFIKQEAVKKMELVKKEIIDRVGDYVIEDHLKDELEKILPSYMFFYQTDFKLPDDFVLTSNPRIDGCLNIMVDVKKHPLGEIVLFTLEYKDKKTSFEVRLLKEASLSYSKLEARLINELYCFLKDRF